MGSSCTKKCSKCGFEHVSSTGVGFRFPIVYVETLQKAKDGELGKELYEFFKDHPDGAINAAYVDLCCEACGYFSGDMDLTMYIPNENKPEKIRHGRWTVGSSFEETDYVSWWDLEKYYSEYAPYPHRCEKCGSKMRILKEGEEMLCPECKIPLDTVAEILWD